MKFNLEKFQTSFKYSQEMATLYREETIEIIFLIKTEIYDIFLDIK